MGFGKCDKTTTSPWRSGATLDVIRGLTSQPRPSTPILFPGNGTTTNLSRFVTESPNPLSYCPSGYSGAGLPVIAMMPESVSWATASMSGPGGAMETCTIYGGNTSGTARAILNGDNAISVIPKYALSPGVYTVTVTSRPAP